MNRWTCAATATVVFLISMVLAVGSTNSTPFQADLRYKDRGDRYEGIKGFPVSDRIELLSAMVDYEEPTGQMPPYFRLKFFLKNELLFLLLFAKQTIDITIGLIVSAHQ